MITIGIDPGKSGAIAFYDGRNIVALHRNTESPFEIRNNFYATTIELKDVYYALVEKVNPMPGEGVSSSFAFGRSFGHLEMLLTVFNIQHQLISPQAWMKQFVPNRPRAKKDASPSEKAKVKSERKRYIRDEVLRRCPGFNKLAIIDADACALAIMAWDTKQEKHG